MLEVVLLPALLLGWSLLMIWFGWFLGSELTAGHRRELAESKALNLRRLDELLAQQEQLDQAQLREDRLRAELQEQGEIAQGQVLAHAALLDQLTNGDTGGGCPSACPEGVSRG